MATVPGMMYPTQKAMLAGTPRDSAQAAMTASNQSQAMANKLMSGGIRRRKRGGANSLDVPQYTMPYTPQGGPGTNPNDQIRGNSQTSTQMMANNKFDNYATIKGGTRRKTHRRSSKKRGGKRHSMRRKSRKHRK
jgi:hypothetical protein